MTYIPNRNFLLEVSKGNVPKHSLNTKFGRNNDIDTGAAEDIWMQGGTFVEPTTARVHALVSNDLNDTSAGTGARTVYVEGLDSSYNTISETVTMNGLVNVNTVNSYTFINRMHVLTFGSTGTNQGNITATAATDATVSAMIASGTGQTLNTPFMVPNAYKAYLININMSFQQSTANNLIDVLFMTKDFGSGGYRTRDYFNLSNSGAGAISIPYNYLQIPAKTIIKFRAQNASANNNDVSVNYSLIIVQD